MSEQPEALRLANVLEKGRFAISGPAASVREDPELKRAYLGL
jgi:ABC-type branched-subunit amino acid transport system ATPase component